MTGLFLSAAHARLRPLRVLLLCGLTYSPSATFAVEMQDSNMAALDRGEMPRWRVSGQLRSARLARREMALVFRPGVKRGFSPEWTALLNSARCPNRRHAPGSCLDGKTVTGLADDAIAEIVKRARKTRVVILNEAHDTSIGRAFGLEVARALRPLAYSLLAVEALSNRSGATLPGSAPLLEECGGARCRLHIRTRSSLT